MREDFTAIELDSEIREVGFRVSKDAEIVACIEECAEDAETSLHMDLAPFLRLGIPVFERHDAGAGHAEIRCVEHVSGLGFELDFTVSEAEDF